MQYRTSEQSNKTAGSAFALGWPHHTAPVHFPSLQGGPDALRSPAGWPRLGASAALYLPQPQLGVAPGAPAGRRPGCGSAGTSHHRRLSALCRMGGPQVRSPQDPRALQSSVTQPGLWCQVRWHLCRLCGAHPQRGGAHDRHARGPQASGGVRDGHPREGHSQGAWLAGGALREHLARLLRPRGGCSVAEPAPAR